MLLLQILQVTHSVIAEILDSITHQFKVLNIFDPYGICLAPNVQPMVEIANIQCNIYSKQGSLIRPHLQVHVTI